MYAELGPYTAVPACPLCGAISLHLYDGPESIAGSWTCLMKMLYATIRLIKRRIACVTNSIHRLESARVYWCAYNVPAKEP
jgi:hypothetical protein